MAADLLDTANLFPYLRAFMRRAPGRPRLWGLHNYQDVNLHTSADTRRMLATVPGELWLTETGGIVRFGDSAQFGYSESRAAHSTRWLFTLAGRYDAPRRGRRSTMTRVYVYKWFGEPPDARFDAGLDRHVRHPARRLLRLPALRSCANLLGRCQQIDGAVELPQRIRCIARGGVNLEEAVDLLWPVTVGDVAPVRGDVEPLVVGVAVSLAWAVAASWLVPARRRRRSSAGRRARRRAVEAAARAAAAGRAARARPAPWENGRGPPNRAARLPRRQASAPARRPRRARSLAGSLVSSKR